MDAVVDSSRSNQVADLATDVVAHVSLGAHKPVYLFARITAQKRDRDDARVLIEQPELTAGTLPAKDALEVC